MSRTRRELRVRGAQRLAIWGERAGLVRARSEGVDAAGLLDRLRAGDGPLLSPAFLDNERTRAALAEMCTPDLVATADRIVDGHFDLLGFRGLSFGSPIDWHLEPITGARFPQTHWSRSNVHEHADRKIVWELNRHGSFVVLGRAYFLTGEERYADAFTSRLGGWLEQNPPGVGVNWSSSLEVALRTIAWTWALTLFRTSDRLTPAVMSAALDGIAAHAQHVTRYLSTYFSPNTHLTGEALGLFCAGTLWPELPGAERWRALGLDVLLAELERQVLPDGVYFERATGYHRYTIDLYAHLVAVATANGQTLPPQVDEALTRLLEHLRCVTRPDGTMPLLGDDDGGRVVPLDDRDYLDVRPTLALGACLLDRPDAAHAPGEEVLWLLGPDAVARLEPTEQRAPTSRAFPDGGVYVMRNGSDMLTIECGAQGGAHDHADVLGLELTVAGRLLLVDPGTYTYLRGDGMGDPFRETSAHNTVVVDGEPSSVPAGAFGWESCARGIVRTWLSTDRFDFFEGAHDGYARLDVKHSRSILFVKRGFWIIRDRLAASGRHRYDLHFHFAVGVQPTLQAGTPPVVDAGFARLVTLAEGSWRIGEGYVSQRYGSREPAAVATFTAQAQGTHELVTFVFPQRVDACAE